MIGSREAARTLISQLVEAYNAHDRDTLAGLYHEDARYWSTLSDWQDGLPVILSHIEELHRRLPDEQMAVGALVTDGDTVVVEFVSRGTAPGGQIYELDFTEVIELVEGKIATVKVYLDPEEVARITS